MQMIINHCEYLMEQPEQGSISRMFIPFAKELHVNDNEYYAHILNRTYVDIPDKDMRMITQLHMDNMNYIVTHGPFVTDGPIQKIFSKDTTKYSKRRTLFLHKRECNYSDTLKEYAKEYYSCTYVCLSRCYYSCCFKTRK